jgi:hypothetical protein
MSGTSFLDPFDLYFCMLKNRAILCYLKLSTSSSAVPGSEGSSCIEIWGAVLAHACKETEITVQILIYLNEHP